MEDYKYILAKTSDEFDIAKELFVEYANSKGFDLSYQNFEAELDELNVQYNIPTGGLILIQDINSNYVGCGGIRKHEDSVAEIKRMYIKNECRGKGLGKKLLDSLIDIAKDLNYSKIRLDTLVSLEVATHIYREKGFIQIAPYRHNPSPEALYFELDLENV
jgi:putative acetyltransferase